MKLAINHDRAILEIETLRGFCITRTNEWLNSDTIPAGLRDCGDHYVRNRFIGPYWIETGWVKPGHLADFRGWVR